MSCFTITVSLDSPTNAISFTNNTHQGSIHLMILYHYQTTYTKVPPLEYDNSNSSIINVER